jgi:hypothetical protein
MIFTKEKYDPSGKFEKLKARLVGGGHQQDRTIYSENEISSPTISTTAVFTMAAIAAKECRKVITMDVGGAYLHADLEKPVYMRLDPVAASILCDIDSQYKKHLLRDGSCIVLLKKALYGCIESARLWYNRFDQFIIKLGYIRNPVEKCVYNKYDKTGTECTVGLYVDDTKASSRSESLLNEFECAMNSEFGECTSHKGSVIPYLGMVFDYSVRGCVSISMPAYIDDLLKFFDVEGICETPARENLFIVNDNAQKLDNSQQALFHTGVAKTLYLTKRARPDTQLAIGFLTSRVQSPDVDDWKKFMRVLKYLNGTRDMGLCLEPGDSSALTMYVDASYGVHSDGKSHTGMCMSLGKGTILAKSNKQKIVTKSSTEAELVALSDMASDAICLNDFLEHQGEKPGAVNIKQDNMSTISMITKGKSSAGRSKHINIRYYWLTEKIENNDITISYVPTNDMIADILTKPLQGELFRKLRNMLLNWYD